MSGNSDPFDMESESSADNVEETLLAEPTENVPIPDDDDDSEDEAPSHHVERPSRKEKRLNRYRKLSEEVAQLKQQLAERQQTPPYIPPQYQEPQRQPSASQHDDDVSSELQAVYDQQRELQLRYAKLSDSERESRYDEFYRQAQKLDIEKNKLIARDTARIEAQRAQKQAQADLIRTQNADIFNWRPPGANPHSNPTGGAYFESVWKRMVLAEGKPDTYETMNAALAETRRVLKIGRSPSPSEGLKSKFGGAPRGGAAKEAPKSFPMTKQYKRMARAAYPHLPEEKAIEKWVKTTGRDLLDGKDD